MPKINPRINSLDDLLGVAREVENTAAAADKPAQPAHNGIQMLPPQIIRSFRGHPFRLYEGNRLNDLVDSISENGVLVPAIIRKIEPDENGFEYEMLAGHNRQNAASIAKRDLPCIVKENLSDHDAWIYVIETNVLQRSFSEMLPSEKAAVLALRYSKMICQGRRNDIIQVVEATSSMLSFGDVEIYPASRRVLKAGKEIRLNHSEYSTLYCLAKSPGRVYTREQLYAAAWNEEYQYGMTTVDNTIWRLRKKLEPDPKRPTFIKTVFRFGYKLDT